MKKIGQIYIDLTILSVISESFKILDNMFPYNFLLWELNLEKNTSNKGMWLFLCSYSYRASNIKRKHQLFLSKFDF